MSVIKLGNIVNSNPPVVDNSKRTLCIIGASIALQSQNNSAVAKAAGFEDALVVAVGGAGLGVGTTFLQQWNAIADKSNISHVVIWISTNDYAAGYPLGQYDSNSLDSDNTCCGKFFMLNRAIHDYNPFIKVAVFGALPCFKLNVGATDKGESYLIQGNFREYTTEIFKMASNLFLPKLDQWMFLNVAWRWREYITQQDELHFLPAAYNQIFNAQVDFLRRI